MSSGSDAMPIPPQRPVGPTGASPFVGEKRDLFGDDRFEAMLDRALGVAFAPIIEEYRASRERCLGDAPPVTPGPVAGPSEAISSPEAGGDG